MTTAEGARSLTELDQQADLADADLTVQTVAHGIFGLITGVVLAITGPTTPSFRLLEALPGWPIYYGVFHTAISACLLLCRFRGGRPRLGVYVLALMAIGYAATGIVLWVTWTSWAAGGRAGSEPLLVAVPVCLFLGLQTAYLAAILIIRRHRGLGPVCRT